MQQPINTIIFDLGGVLIDWNPRYLYRKIFRTEEEIEWFLSNICTSEWNDLQDAGRPFEEAIRERIEKFPDHHEPITAWHTRWKETISGPIEGTVDILRHLRDSRQYRLYALTNWSSETFPWTYENFDFLHWFEGIVVSGVEKMRKPNPAFFQVLFDRYQIIPQQSVFIDDNPANIEAANRLGLNTIPFREPGQLADDLRQWNIAAPPLTDQARG